ncbi:MAG: oxygen-independent coproporphyrinogen III oxidase [Hyphomicrobium sp.]|uniref:oxygen-independent coproporphyrinogen III oxidase n=1 Tax=Hyphomicrobium sp. TaxID=82 RepID=UPI003D0E85C1
MRPLAPRALAERHAAAVPRYTSYPTAPHFTGAIGPRQAAAWMSALSDGTEISLYVHIPFCRALCWYCGCTTAVANGRGPISAFLASLDSEMGHAASLLPTSCRVSHLHWGGGSPNILSPSEIRNLAARTYDLFRVADGAEFAVEIDPRFMDAERANAFADAGVNRVSLGVQDFDPKVQAAINRHQSYAQTAHVVALLCEAGIQALNIDLVYGLPGQTAASVAATVDKVLALDPDRVAVFGYAHLPDKIRHQRLIDSAMLAGPGDRLGQANRIARKLVAAGYVRVGLDHFAKPNDPLATGTARRNFQGYTTDRSDTLIGFGASAISRFAQGYAQNAAHLLDYQARVEAHGLGTARGVAMSDEDRLRGHVIERLMCDLSFSASDLRRRFGAAALALIAEASDIVEADQDGLVEPTSDGFRITERGRPFVRTICACFDAYLGEETAQFANGA